MASIGAADHGGWQFSLGSLFRATAICGVAMWAIIELGAVAAARDVGIGCAIALSLEAWTARSRRSWYSAGLVAGIGCIPTILAAGAPFADRSAVCLECGLARETHGVCGWTTKDEMTTTEASHWAASLVSAGHGHRWTATSVHQRSSWFGIAPIGCGGPGEGAFMAWQLARCGDQAAAEQAYREYQQILTGKSPKSMAVHRQEMSDAVNRAVQAKR